MRSFGGLIAGFVAVVAWASGCAGTKNSGGGRDGGGSVAMTGGGGSGGTTGGGEGGELSVDVNCGFDHYPLEPIPPDVLVVLDISQSMLNDFDDSQCLGCQDKWSAMKTALNTVLNQTETRMRWGLKYFPNPGSDLQANPCNANATVQVPIAPTNGSAVNSNISLTSPGGRTPTREGLTSGIAHLKALTDPNPKFILLATDGLPNCRVGCVPSADPTMDPRSCTLSDADQTIAAIRGAAMDGIQTFVIGIGSIPDSERILDQMAMAGGRPQAASPLYYPANNATELASVLTDVSGMLVSCSFPLSQTPPDPTNIAIDVGTTRVPKDTTHTDGWDYAPDMRSIQLYGPSCRQVMAIAVKDVQVIFGCPGVVIP